MENCDVQQSATAAAADDDVCQVDNTADELKSSKPSRQQRVYNCTSCSRVFSSRREMVTHQYMHRENPTAYCSVCNKSFGTEAAYRRHALSHSRKSAAATSRRAGKTCSQCNMQFDTMRQLSAHHAATHVDEKKFVCAICGSQFAWPENLRAHQRTHQLDPHECETCGRRFVDATSLRVHTRNSHGPRSENAPPRKQHCCKLCGRSFQFDFSLKAHMKGHAQSPAAASLRRWKCQPDKIPQDTEPLTCTRYVHMDSKGVIELGQDVVRTGENRSSEIIVEVYNYESNNSGRRLDFSDVLDQSGTTSCSVTERDDTETVGMNSSASTEHVPRLVWYVKPDVNEEAEAEQDVEEETRDKSDVQQKTEHSVETKAVTETQQSSNAVQLDNGPAAAAAAETPDDADGREDEVERGRHVESVECQDELTEHNETSAHLRQTLANSDDDDANDSADTDWMEVEPAARRRAVPFIYRRASSCRRRRITRPREPFLFNCVMTDEKPFICVTCGQCFRWEISLNIHRRLHTDGSYPNNMRGGGKQRSRAGSVSASRRQPTSSVARSRIVRHRHTSSDEDDDEFTFHVHAEGPSEVSVRYPSGRRRAGRALAARGLARKQSVKTSVSTSGDRGGVEAKRAGRGRLNGLQTGRQPPGRRRVRVQNLRVGLVCRHCHQVVTTVHALKSHRRRHYRSGLQSRAHSQHR